MTSPAIPPLALRPRDAAAALGVSERTLWSLTAPRGPIPCVHAGRAVLYRVADLDAWLAAAATPAAGDDACRRRAGARSADRRCGLID